MIELLCSSLLAVMKVPAVFSYCSTRMILAAITSLVVTICFGPYCIRRLYALKTGQSLRVEDCPLLADLHRNKKHVPTMGGVLILFSMLVSLLLWMDLKNIFTSLLAFTTIWLGGVGAVDDYLKMKHRNSKGLSSLKKFLFQVALAVIIGSVLFIPSLSNFICDSKWFSPISSKMGTTVYSCSELYGVYFLPFKKGAFFFLSGLGVIAAFLLTIFVVTGSSNAVNLTDGLDGLAAGCLIMVAAVFAVFAFLSNNIETSRYLNIIYINGIGEVGVYMSAMAGACLGFLWYNGSPAQVFMGDVGSLSLGGILGVSAVLMRREFLLALVGAIFVVEALSVIIQVGCYRCFNKKRVFRCAPLHHHFEFKGLSETKVVIRFWVVSLVLTLLGLASIKFQ